MEAKPDPREHLRKAAEEVAAYERETCCVENRNAVEPVRTELLIHYRTDELLDKVTQKRIERTKQATAVHAEGMEVAKKEGIPVTPVAPERERQRVMPFSMQEFHEHLVSVRKGIFSSIPKPRDLFRVETMEERRARVLGKGGSP